MSQAVVWSPDLEEVVCAVCGSAEASPVLWGRDWLGDVPGDFRIVRCRTCGLQFVSPRPTAPALLSLYRQGVFQDRWPRGWRVNYARVPGDGEKQSRLATWVVGQKPAGRALDVGCGDGSFLIALKDRGWQVYGVDPDPHGVERCRDRGLANVYCGDAGTLNYSEGSFDLITLWNVLEHLHDPAAVLEKVRRLLREDGLVALKVPNADSLQAKVLGAYWVGYDLPWHLYHFDLRTLSAMLGRAGIRVVRVGCLSGSYDALVRSLLALGMARGWEGWRAAALRALATSLLTRAAVKPANLLLDGWRRGAILTVVGRVGRGQY